MFRVFTFLLLMPFICQSQTITFADSTNTWHLLSVYNSGGIFTVANETFGFGSSDSSGIYRHLSASNSYSGYVREDLATKQVYVRMVTFEGSAADTAEMLLYDFSLQQGDTFTVSRLPNILYMHIVDSIDQVLVDGIPHRRQFLLPLPGSAPGSAGYAVIEGIGCTAGPFYPYNPHFFEAHYYMNCFRNKGSYPVLDPATGYVAIFKNGATQFLPYHNDNTCNPVAVEEPQSESPVETVFPQPADKDVMIRFRSPITGSLTIADISGRTKFEMLLNKTHEVQVNRPDNALFVFFTVRDVLSEKVYRGKLLFLAH
ncbi:MAG: hypothetical protein EOP49_06500 [Sphingobacteriales bacterium]|nr:MAG: hypothetical protein EOP49_06500 [Sphingobacteriales bacterium]